MEVSEILKEVGKLKNEHFSGLSAFQEGKQLGLTYHFIKANKPVNLTTIFNASEVIPSITDIIPYAGTYEIEAHEMFGVKFSKLERKKMFLSDDWKKKAPLKK
jgi:NADH:ubiquinone oxidoreductase subunit C